MNNTQKGTSNEVPFVWAGTETRPYIDFEILFFKGRPQEIAPTCTLKKLYYSGTKNFWHNLLLSKDCN